MRIVMAATGDFALPTLEALANGGHELVALVTQPDRPAGRGRRVAESRVKQAVVTRGVPTVQPERIATAEMSDRVADWAPELLLVVAYGQKIPAALCDLPPLGAINVHGSLLPALRGAAPCNWAIVRGLKETGVTVQFLAEEMDAGDVLGSRRVAIGPRETAPELHDRLAIQGAEEVLEVLDRLAAGTARPTPQDPSKVTYAPRLRKADGAVDWSRDAEEIDGMVRGMKPWPGAYTYLMRPGRSPLRILLEDVRPEGDEGAGQLSGATPGTILETRGDLVVATGRGRLAVAALKPQSAKRMSGEAFCNGHDVRCGQRFAPVPDLPEQGREPGR